VAIRREDTNDGKGLAHLVFPAASVLLVMAIIISTGLEWGSLSVQHRLVVAETGVGEWQGVAVLITSVIGLLAMGLALAVGRRALAAAAVLVTGLVVVVMAFAEVVHLATRPQKIADVVGAAADSIPLKGYLMPLIESSVGAGTWLALLAGALLFLVGLVALVAPVWQARHSGH